MFTLPTGHDYKFDNSPWWLYSRRMDQRDLQNVFKQNGKKPVTHRWVMTDEHRALIDEAKQEIVAGKATPLGNFITELRSIYGSNS